MAYEEFVALRYLRSPRKDRSISIITTISIIGVALGVMALVVVLSVMNGFTHDLRKALMGANPHITVRSYTFGSEGFKDYNKVAKEIKDHIKAKSVTPFTMNQSLVMGKGKPRGALIRGVDPEQEIIAKTLHPFIRLTRKSKEDLKKYEDTLAKEIQEKIQILGSSKTSVKLDQKIQAELKQLRKKDKKPSKEVVEAIIRELSPTYTVYTTRRGKVRKGKLSGIILGRQLADALDVNRNDVIRMISSEERVSPMGRLPRVKLFRVIAFFESGISGYDEVLAYTHIRQAQKIFRLGTRITGLAINVNDPQNAAAHKKKLRDILTFIYKINTWIDFNKNVFSLLKLETFALAIILALIILVASFNIIGSLIMLVIEKTKDIAILKSMGATNLSILKIFMIQGSLIGLIGTIVGLIGGLLICLIVKNYKIIDIPAGVYPGGDKIPMMIEPWQIVTVAIVSFLICFFVTILPSYKAAQIDPAQGVRYE
ncbi:MAG: lipoprotein-releasing system permease protein [bacterium]